MTPSTMAPTKANAIYAVTTLNLLTKVMGIVSLGSRRAADNVSG
jgi:hypothetical protein